MLHYSLTSLAQQISRPKFDIVVYLCCNDETFDWYSHYHLNRFCLPKDFPGVKFIVSDYRSNDAYMSKWYHMQKVFELGYDQVFYLDCDTMFFADPSEFFSLESGYVYCLFEIRKTANDILLNNHHGMNSGHILIDHTVFEKIPNFYNTLCKKRSQLNSQAQELYDRNQISESDLEEFCYFNEQYCAQMSFLEHKIDLRRFDPEKINWGADNRKLAYDSEGNVMVDPHPSVILHYTSAGAHMFLPYRYHTKYFKKQLLTI